MSSPGGSRRQPLRALPAGIWALGFGSLLMDSSSELIHSVLPVFMVSVLGALRWSRLASSRGWPRRPEAVV